MKPPRGYKGSEEMELLANVPDGWGVVFEDGDTLQ